MNTDKMEVLNRDIIKYIAIVIMLVCHVANRIDIKNDIIYEFFYHAGFFVAPTMCYFLVEGYRKTSSRAKYGLRLLLFAVISQICYLQAYNTDSFNMIFTLLICFVILCVQDDCKNKYIKAVICIGLVITTAVLDCHWQIGAPIFVIFLNKCWGKPKSMAMCFFGLYAFNALNDTRVDWLYTSHSFVSCLSHSMIASIPILLSGICLLLLYNGKRAEHCKTINKWAFYIIYPLHYLLLALI